MPPPKDTPSVLSCASFAASRKFSEEPGSITVRRARVKSSVQSSSSVRARTHGCIVPYCGRWEGQLSELCVIVETDETLSVAQIVELQCRKQMIGLVLHRFLLIRLRIRGDLNDGESEVDTEAFLRLDRRADPTASIGDIIWRGGATDSNDCAMLARTPAALLMGPPSTVEASYPFLHQPPPLADLVPFLRICCEELVRYCIWPDNCWFFCSLIASFLADQRPEDLDVSHLKNTNLATKVRRRVRIRYHISMGRPIETLSYVEQLELVLSTTKGEIIASKESARDLIKLDHRISTKGTTCKTFMRTLAAISPMKFFQGIRMNQQWLTVSLSETLHDVWRHPRKSVIFQDVSKRFREEAAMRGLAPIAGSRATTELADVGWKLVKYRLYLPAADAALLMRGVERLARQLLEKEPSIYHHGLLHETLTAYGEELGGSASVTGEPRHKKRDVFEDAVKMARLLNNAEPGAHLDSLADSLGSYCLALAELGEYEKASEACRESIELWRELYSQQTAGRSFGDGDRHWQQVFRDFCWCFCVGDGSCDAISEVLNLADATLNETSPVQRAEWPIMLEQYGTFLKAAAAAPKDCKSLPKQ